MWTALLLMTVAFVALLALAVGVASFVRFGLQDAYGDATDDELWLRDASSWL